MPTKGYFHNKRLTKTEVATSPMNKRLDRLQNQGSARTLRETKQTTCHQTVCKFYSSFKNYQVTILLSLTVLERPYNFGTKSNLAATKHSTR